MGLRLLFQCRHGGFERKMLKEPGADLAPDTASGAQTARHVLEADRGGAGIPPGCCEHLPPELNNPINNRRNREYHQMIRTWASASIERLAIACLLF
jgi:hypothetical protein